MACKRRKIQEMLDKFSEELRKIRNDEIIHRKIYHREGDCWWIEHQTYVKDSDGNLLRKS